MNEVDKKLFDQMLECADRLLKSAKISFINDLAKVEDKAKITHIYLEFSLQLSIFLLKKLETNSILKTMDAFNLGVQEILVKRFSKRKEK